MRRSKFFATVIIGIQLVPSIVLAQGAVAPAQDIGRPIHAPTQASPSPSPVDSPSNTPNSQPSVSPRPSASPSPAQFCDNLTSVTGKIGTNTTDQFDQLKTNFMGGPAKVKNDMASVSQSLAAARATADQKRATDFAALSSKATSPFQKQAIATFEASVTQAIMTERQTVDAADAAFGQGILSAMATRQADLQTAATAYRSAVEDALAAAKTSCAAGTSAETVRSTLQTSLQTARNNLQTASNNSGKLGPNLNTLEATRKAAVAQAEATAKASIASTLATLKAALGIAGDISNPSPSPVD
jgi:hypothetical protein